MEAPASSPPWLPTLGGRDGEGGEGGNPEEAHAGDWSAGRGAGHWGPDRHPCLPPPGIATGDRHPDHRLPGDTHLYQPATLDHQPHHLITWRSPPVPPDHPTTRPPGHIDSGELAAVEASGNEPYDTLINHTIQHLSVVWSPYHTIS